MICASDEQTIATWRDHGIPDDQSTRDHAAHLVLKLADERDEWRALATELVDHVECDCRMEAGQQVLALDGEGTDE